MRILAGTWDPAWGHTWIAKGFGKLYVLRSLPKESSMLVWDEKSLQLLGEFPTPGEHSCHITLLKRQAVVSDYTSGTLSLFPLSKDGMPLGELELIRFQGSSLHPERQQSPHIHSSWLSPKGDSIVVADLGTDRVYRFGVSKGMLVKDDMESFNMPSGCGPRHCAFGKGVLYVTTELSDEVLVLSWPKMELKQRVLVNPERPGGGGHILLSPDGKYLYASSRLKADGIYIFSVSPDGLLTPTGSVPTGAHPRHFCLAEDGVRMLVACRDDNCIQLFKRSKKDGQLTPSKHKITLEKPVFVDLDNY